MMLNQYIRELRRIHKYKQDFLADQLGVSRQTYSAYETGRITPTITSLTRLANFYCVSVESFIEKMNIKCDDMIELDRHYVPSVQIEQSSNPSAEVLKRFLEFNLKKNEKFNSLSIGEKWLLFYFSNMDTNFRNEVMSYLAYRYSRDVDLSDSTEI